MEGAVARVEAWPARVTHSAQIRLTPVLGEGISDAGAGCGIGTGRTWGLGAMETANSAADRRKKKLRSVHEG